MRDVPQVFGITEEAKGFFPHYFNTDENQHYIGVIPDKKYYSPENMPPGVYEEFNEWYDTQAGKTFNFKEDVIKYCRSDVKVLAMGVLKFRQIYYNEFDVDPFRYFTLSSV